MNKKQDSKEVTRKCEKCNQPSLLLTQEIKGKTSINVVIKIDEGVVAERWSCQKCDHFFQISLESPNPFTVWFVMGLIPAIIGLIAIIISIVQMCGILPKPDNFTFTLIFGITLVIIGTLVSIFALYKRNILKRNPIVDGIIPPPMIERTENLPYDRKPRLCSCGLKMHCIGDTKRSFNMIPMGTDYTFRCESNQTNTTTTCNKEIKIESIWRSIILSFIGFILALILNYFYSENMIESIVGWVFFCIGTIIVLYIVIYRTWRIYSRIKYPRVKVIY